MAFDSMTDKRRAQYLAEWNNSKTTAERKKAIDAKWGFSSNSSAGGTAPAGLKGFLSQVPSDASKFFTNIDSAKGALSGQQGINQYNAYLNSTLNRPNEQDPFGSLSYSFDPTTGQLTRKMQSSDTQAGINNSIETLDQKNLGGAIYKRDQASETMRDPYSLSDLPQRSRFGLDGLTAIPGAGDLTGERRRVEDSLYQRFADVNEPRFQRETAAKDQELRNQGLMPGSVGYKTAMDMVSQQQEDARRGARSQALGMGLDEQQGQFGMGLQSRQQQVGERSDLSRISGDERTQATQEYEAQRYAPVTEMQMFQGATRGFMAPPSTAMTAVDVGNVDVPGTSLGFKALDKPMAMMAGGWGGGGGGVVSSPYARQYDSLASGSPYSRGGATTQGGGYTGPSTTDSLVNGFSNGVGYGATQSIMPKAAKASGNSWTRRAW